MLWRIICEVVSAVAVPYLFPSGIRLILAHHGSLSRRVTSMGGQ